MSEIGMLVLEVLRYIRADLGAMKSDLRDIKRRMTEVEIAVGQNGSNEAGHYGSLALRLDQIDDRLLRLEQIAELPE